MALLQLSQSDAELLAHLSESDLIKFHSLARIFHATTGETLLKILTDLAAYDVETSSWNIKIPNIDMVKVYHSVTNDTMAKIISDIATYDEESETWVVNLGEVGEFPAHGHVGTGISLDTTNLFGFNVANMQALAEAIDLDRFPNTPPTYEAPFAETLLPLGGVTELRKVGDVLNENIFFFFDAGKIMLNGEQQNVRAGEPIAYYLTGPQMPATEVDNSGGFPKALTNYKVVLGNQQWGCYVQHSAGPQPKTARNLDFETGLDAGYVPAQDGGPNYVMATMRGVVPIYATINAIATLDELPALYNDETANNIEITLLAETGGNKQRLQFHKETWFDSRTLLGIQQWDTLTQTWFYPKGSAANSLTLWTVTDEEVTIDSVVYNVKRYTHNGETRGQVKIRLIF